MTDSNTKYYSFILMLASIFFVACDSESPDVPADGEVRYSDVPIVPTASIVTAQLSRGDFEGPVNGKTFSTNSTKIFGVTAYLGYEIPDSWQANSRVNFASVNCDVNGNYIFDEWKYYPLDYKMYFYAFSPMVKCTLSEGDATTHPSVSYVIDGFQDVMWSKNENGILKADNPVDQKQPDFQFQHKLQRVIFEVRRTTGVSAASKISEIRINDLYDHATLDLITGDLVFDTTREKTAFHAVWEYSPTTDFVIYPKDIMFQPGVTELDITLVLDDTDYNAHVSLTGDHAGEAGYKHIIRITVDGATLSIPTPEILPWDGNLTADGDI